MLTAAELTSLKAEAEASLPSTAIIRPYTLVSDSQGGETRTYADGASVACRLARSTTATESGDAGGKATAQAFYELLVPVSATIRPRDRVSISGVEYEVTEGDNPRSESILQSLAIVRLT